MGRYLEDTVVVVSDDEHRERDGLRLSGKISGANSTLRRTDIIFLNTVL